MAKVLKAGNSVGQFSVKAEVNRGAQAISYRATSKDGKAVFLKQYKSPSIVVSWFHRFVDYQKELRQRIESSRCKHFCYSFLDSFEHNRCFFQAFEFLDHSDSLSEFLSKCHKDSSHVTFEQRLIVAKVMMAGIAALHEQKIVHADLKPDNIMLIRDESVVAGYRFRVIDMDFSVLSDIPAPWHGEQGYFGTPGYFSPEHVMGGVPVEASDVFTSGLMLYEILAGYHPYHDLSDEEYRDAIMHHRAEAPRLLPGTIGPDLDGLISMLHRCLHPESRRRPTALQVNKQLNGHSIEPTPLPTRVTFEMDSGSIKEESFAGHSRKPGDTNELSSTLILKGENGQSLKCNVKTTVGKNIAACWGPDSDFFGREQFVVYPQGNHWLIETSPSTPNSTFLNGRHLDKPQLLKDGAVISLGNASTGVQRLKITVALTERAK